MVMSNKRFLDLSEGNITDIAVAYLACELEELVFLPNSNSIVRNLELQKILSSLTVIESGDLKNKKKIFTWYYMAKTHLYILFHR